MTVIAYDRKGGTISCDSRCSGNGHIYNDTTVKFIHMPDGAIAFFCGNWDEVLKLKKIMREGGDWQEEVNGDAVVIVSHPNGRIEEFRCPTGETITNSEAWGSGNHYALGALHVGADSIKAAKASLRYDNACGGKIHTFKTKRA